MGQVCIRAGIWVAACGHSHQIALAVGERFPPCPECGKTAWNLKPDESEEAPWRGMFTDQPAGIPPVGWRLPAEAERPPARTPIPNLKWLPEHGDEDE